MGWSREIFIPRESGGWPVHAPYPMRESRFPDAGLPSGRLLFLTYISSLLYFNIFNFIFNYLIFFY